MAVFGKTTVIPIRARVSLNAFALLCRGSSSKVNAISMSASATMRLLMVLVLLSAPSVVIHVFYHIFWSIFVVRKRLRKMGKVEQGLRRFRLGDFDLVKCFLLSKTRS